MSMIAPIFAYEHGDLLVFDSIVAAERYLEPIDIQNREYVIYDRRGQLLSGRVDPLHGVKLSSTTPPDFNEQKLHQVLSQFLRDVGTPADQLRGAALDRLVELAMKFPTK